MMIRKISIGADYKSSSMHYIHGQDVLNNEYIIHLIQYDSLLDAYKIWIEREGEILLWKQFNSNMPVSIEYNINF
jgi:predicted RNA-binding protein with PUA domain